jgi:hypothetical protein
MKTWGSIAPPFLTLALDGGEWSASHPVPLHTPGERAAGIHWIGSWVGAKVGLDAVSKLLRYV